MSDTGASVRLTRYRRADRAEVLAFVRAAHPNPDGERLIRQWDWKYDANPFNRDPEPYILLMREGPEIIGMLGSMPLRFWIGGREQWVSHSCDWAMHPKHRDRGLARMLVKQHRIDRPLRFSWQNEKSYERSQQRPDTRTVRIVPLVKPLDTARVLERATGNRLLSRLGAAVSVGVERLAHARAGLTVMPGISVNEADGFDQRFDDLSQRMRERHGVMVARDRAYLQWRFGSRPDARYTVLLATRSADVVGYLVLRCAEEEGTRWGYLVDFLVEDASAGVFSLLVEHALRRFREERVAAVSCRTTVPAYRWALYRRGFYPFFWGRRGYMRININTPDPAVQIFGEVRQWHVTMGDGDLEMVF